jgi:flagellar biosynthesis/type III secretory pathway M-ring protein FliF/YscJ
MSTGLIIAIVVVALVLIVLLAFVLPRMRHRSQVKARQHELEDRREQAATEHREHADERARTAERAEERARMAEAEARRERADADLHQQRAERHERGAADDELIREGERDRFAETSAGEPRRSEDPDVPASEYERGRIDERRAEEGRFQRGTAPDRTDQPSGRGY